MKKPRLSGSTKAVMRKPNPPKRPNNWKLVWPILKYGKLRADERIREAETDINDALLTR